MLLIPVLNPPRKSGKRRKNVATKKKTRRRSTIRTTTRKRGKLTWTEAAAVSGALYPKSYPKWHEKAGQKTGSRAGKAMSKFDALRWKRPVVGYLTSQMVREWYDPTHGGATARKGTKRMKGAVELFKTREGQLAQYRKEHGTPWKRHPQYYKRGKKKGKRKKDYKVLFGKVKFRSGRGPASSVKVYRGFSPSQRQIDRLVAGGFAGHTSAPGGKVKLNKPRRRRKARKRPARTKSGRFRKKARKNPRRRTRGKKRKSTRRRRRKAPQLYNNPRRRKRRRKSKRKGRRRRKAYSYKANPRRRKRRRKSKARPRRRKRRKKAYKANPRGRKCRRRRRRRKSTGMRRYSNNPMRILKGMINDLKDTPKWITAGHILFGMGLNGSLCGYALTRTPLARVRFLQQRGVVGSLARLAVCGLGAGVISAVGAIASRALGNPKLLRGARTNLLIGGMAYALANFAYEVMPGPAGMLFIPQVSAPQRRGLPSGGVEGWGPDYKYGYGGGMGSVISPEDLVAGESLARNVNEFSGMNDWMELSGLGSSGGAPVPMEDLRGYPGQYGGGMGGMNDWVELTSNNALVRAGFDPGVEAF